MDGLAAGLREVAAIPQIAHFEPECYLLLPCFFVPPQT
jgi:hypothetical protein